MNCSRKVPLELQIDSRNSEQKEKKVFESLVAFNSFNSRHTLHNFSVNAVYVYVNVFKTMIRGII